MKKTPNKFLNTVRKVLGVQELNRAGTVALLSTILEWYDSFLFAYILVFLAPAFFPDGNHIVATSVMIITYLASIFGAVIFGDIGDKHGRKTVIVWVIFLLTLTTTFICILPPYEQIGITSSIIFILLRLINSFGSGGGNVGITVFVNEEAPPGKRGLFTGILSRGCAVGMAIGAIAIALVNPQVGSMHLSLLKLPLLLSPLGFIVFFYFRSKVPDSSIFLKSRIINKGTNHHPILLKLKKYFQNLTIFSFSKEKIKILAIIFCLFALDPIFNIFIYGLLPFLLVRDFNFSYIHVMFLSAVGTVVFALFAKVFGKMSDKVGKRPILMIMSCVLFVFSLSLPFWVSNGSFLRIIVAQFSLLLISSAYYTPSTVLVVESLPTIIRCSGMAFSLALVNIFLGGGVSAYVLNASIYNKCNIISSFYFLSLASFIVFVTVLLVRETTEKQLDKIHEKDK